MKKLMIALLMVVATSTASFAKGSNYNVQTAAKDVVQKVMLLRALLMGWWK